MKKKIKKAFTLVELLVVIAILAILATVSIVGYNSFTKKARVSNDTVLVKQMNDILYANSQTDDVNPTMSKALEDVFDGGYDLTKLTPTTTNYNIMWDRANDQMVLADENLSYVYPEASKVSEKPEDLFVVVKTKTELETRTNAGYSVYLHDDFTETEITNLKAGLDAGECNNVSKITYIGDSTTQNVVIRTNGSDLVVNAPNSHVEHYGLAKEVNVQAVSDSTYVENGTVSKMETAADAKSVVINKDAVVVKLTNKSSKLTINNGYVGELAEGSTNPVSGTSGGNTISVYNYDQLQALALSSTVEISLKGKTIKLEKDIDLTNKVWTPFGFSQTHPFEGTIDGNNHKIKGLSAKGYVFNKDATIVNVTNKNSGPAYGLICISKNSTIKNLKLESVNIDVPNGIAVGAVVGDSRGSSLTIDNVTVDGEIKAMDKVAGFVGLAGYKEDSINYILKISNSTNNANVTAYCDKNYNRAGGFVGGCGPANNKGKIELYLCTNNGTINVTGNIEDMTANEKTTYWNDAKILSSLCIGPRIYGGQFVGTLNGTSFKSTLCKATGKVNVKNLNSNGTYGYSMVINKFGNNDLDVQNSTVITATNKIEYVEEDNK